MAFVRGGERDFAMGPKKRELIDICPLFLFARLRFGGSLERSTAHGWLSVGFANKKFS